MNAREVEKIVDVDGRRFVISKYCVFAAVKVSKVFVAKILPVGQSVVPMIQKFLGQTVNGGERSMKLDIDNISEHVLKNLADYLQFDKLAAALDLIDGKDLDFIMQQSLMCCTELLDRPAPVMRKDGTFGVEDVEFNAPLAVRLVIETVKWGLSDFFTENPLTSLFKLQSDSYQQNPQI